MTEYKRISLEEFDTKLKPFLNEVSSASLGGHVLSCSDDFFASRHHLIRPGPSLSMKGHFGPNGALYDGWESRRHNPKFDWVIILLAPSLSHLSYVDIDTSHFSGNECPTSQVFALSLPPRDASSKAEVSLSPEDPRWTQILPEVELGPNSRHIFELGKVGKEGTWSAVMVRMIPDGGMARFRAYGQPLPPTPLSSLPTSSSPINLLSPLFSARIIAASDANFSPPGNLLLPGRGHDMSDGWETRRSQEGRGKYGKGGALEGQERKEWVVVRMAGTGVVRYAEVDTAYHPGNYPVACKIEATLCDADMPPADAVWTTIVARKPLGPHRQHYFAVEVDVPPEQVFSHVRACIYPDGGMKRLRIFGHPFLPPSNPTATPLKTTYPPTVPVLPLTYEAFLSFGRVIQGFSLPTSAPKGIHASPANQGTACKFHRLAEIQQSYPEGMLKRGSTYLAATRVTEPRADWSKGGKGEVIMFERHKHTSQAFIPMGRGVLPGSGKEEVPEGGAYICVAALTDKDDKPDLSTMRAFIGTAAQGVQYNENTWHHFLYTINGPLDYLLVEAQIGEVGNKLDCDYIMPPTPFAYLDIPPFPPVSSTPTPAAPRHVQPAAPSALQTITSLLPSLPSSSAAGPIVPQPLTADAFAPFGHVIQPYPDLPVGPDVQRSPDGRVTKYARLVNLVNLYPEGSGAVNGISVFRSTPKVGLERGKVFDVKLMERHPYTSQAFVPMGKAEWAGSGEERLPEGGQMLVIVARGGPDDKPDPATIKAFIMPSSIGVNYSPGVWHHPVLVLDETLDLACVEAQVSTGVPMADPRDCELLEWKGDEVFGRVMVPSL